MEAIREACWEKGERIPGFDDRLWRLDPYGNPIFKPDNINAEQHKFGWSFDHIIPYNDYYGPTKLWNCQPCQRTLDAKKGN